MAQPPIKTEELKKLVLTGKKRPMNLAYNPGSKGNDLLIIDRKKEPDVIARIAKKEGEGNKVAAGVFEIEGKVLSLTAVQIIPELSKQLRKFLKTLGLSLDVVVLDIDGNAVDADADEVEDAAEAKEALADLTRRIRALQGPIAEMGPAAGPLKKAMAKIIGLLKSGSLAKADLMLAPIEKAFARARSRAAEQPAETPPPAQAPAPNVQGFRDRAAALRATFENLEGADADAVKSDLVKAIALFKNKDFATAETHLTAAEETVKNLQSAPAQPEPEPDQSDAVEDAQEPDVEIDPNSPEAQEWAATLAELQTAVDAAMQAGQGDLDGINRAFNYAQSKAAAGDFDSAMQAAATTNTLVEQAANAPDPRQAEAEELTPDNVVAFTRSRLEWIKTRSGLQAELAKLKMAIDAKTAGIDGLEDISQHTGELFDYLADLDTSLQDTLEALVETPDGAMRQKLKEQAKQIVSSYRETLDTDFFQAVDNNGFTETTIRESALNALQEVETALAA